MRLERHAYRVHPRLFRQQVALARVAGAAGRQDVGPGVRATARQRDEMVAGEALPLLELQVVAAAELALVLVAGEQEGVGDLPAEAPRDVNEPDQPDDGGPGDLEALASHHRALVGLDDDGLAVDHEAQGAAHRYHGERL